MSSQVFYRKWRPQTLTELVGQEHVTKTLLNALSSGRVSHAYLFYGPRGTGKTSTGRILAKAVNCLTNGKGEPCNACAMCQAVTEDRALDVIEVDAASNTGVDDIRTLREKVNYAPSEAKYKVYIIDEVHMLSNSASNALLKTLEEPPPHVIFILATTEVHKLLPTIMSRCQRFDFHRISQADVVIKLADVAKAEGIQAEPQVFQLIARSAGGSLRDAENLLEQLTIYYGSELSIAQAQSILGISGDWRAKDLVKKIINNDISGGIATINSVNKDGLDLSQFKREMVEYFRNLLLLKTGAGVDLTTEDTGDLKLLADKATLPGILKALKLFCQVEIGADNYSSLPMELALIDSVISVEDKEPEKASTKSSAPSNTPRTESEPADVVTKPASPTQRAKAPESVLATSPASEPVITAAKFKTETPDPDVSPLMLENELERMKYYWKQILAEAPSELRKSKALALLRSGGIKPVAFDGDVVTLSFKQAIFKTNMEKPENKQIAEKILGNYIGRLCRIVCIHEPESDHLVREAMKLGGQITNVEEK
ncbi:DNA polymerase III subunit gamma/tau [Chloroflexota bacterium]